MPDEVHLATSRSATRISAPGVVRHFSKEVLLSPGEETISRDGVAIRIYSRERMLVELMRSAASMPLDYYCELIASYRKIAGELDLYAVVDYIGLFERNNYMLDILQKEVL